MKFDLFGFNGLGKLKDNDEEVVDKQQNEWIEERQIERC